MKKEIVLAGILKEGKIYGTKGTKNKQKHSQPIEIYRTTFPSKKGISTAMRGQ